MDDEDLISVLKDWPYMGETYAKNAADRIEALTAERDEWMKDSAAAWDKCEARRIDEEVLEAKLAKAMQALKRICMQPDYRLPSPHEIARATIEETSSHNKGENHD